MRSPRSSSQTPVPPRAPSWRNACGVVLALLLVAVPQSGPAQQRGGPGQASDHGIGVRSSGAGGAGGAPPAVVEAAVLGANGLLGGFAAGVESTLRGGEFGSAFLRGMLGGATVYAGKRVGSAGFSGAGLLGRQVAAVGAGMIRNVGAGRGLFSVVRLPAGPLRIALGDVGEAPRVTVNLSDVGHLAYAVAADHLEWRRDYSLSAGTPVFASRDSRVNDDGRQVLGATSGTQIYLYDADRPDVDGTLGHEIVHVLQADFMTRTFSVPLERWLLGKIPWGSRVLDRVEPGVAAFGLEFLLGLPANGRGILWDAREAEAEWLEGR